MTRMSRWPNARTADGALSELKATLSTDVLTARDDGFAAATTNWDYPSSPEVLVRPGTTDELTAVVRWAASHGVEVAVRSGGHGQWVHAPGGLMIDMANFDGVARLDDAHVRLGSGATWGAVADALSPLGLAVSSGDTRSVGVGGNALGGGIGWLVRSVGLASDQLVRATLVTAAGEVVIASESENPELFFAVRGGGGNFGIATHLDFRATELAGVVFATAALDEGRLPATLRSIRDRMSDAARELNVTVVRFPPMGPTGHLPPMVKMLWSGRDHGDADAAFRSILELPGVGAAETRAVPYASALIDPPPLPPGPPPRRVALASLFTVLTDDTIDGAAAALRTHPASVLEVRFTGGALADTSPDATAFGWRSATALVYSLAVLPPTASDEDLDRAGVLWSEVADGSDGVYGPFTTAGHPQTVQRMYPAATLQRLREVKTTWDPDNVFRRNHNVLPIGSEGP